MLVIILIISIMNFLANCIKDMEALKLENIRLIDILTEMEEDIKKLGEK